MPLIKSKSDAAFKSNLKAELAARKPRAQSLAIAYSVKRKARASGGRVHVGPIISTVGGRTDKHAMSVPSGAYVIPADVVSGLKGAQGNTLAGMKILDHLFGPHGPYGSSLARMKHVHRAAGGSVDEPVPIMSAGGEQVIAPEIVQRIGKGNMDHGHRILDAFVKRVRSKNVKTLKNLPGPARD